MKRVRKVISVPMGVKLPPYFDPAHHEQTARVIERVGVDFLSLINSVGNGLVVDPESETVVIKPKGGFGGLGGPLIKPVALANVRAFWKLFKGRLPIIGTGGVVSGTDIFEHLLCGATAPLQSCVSPSSASLLFFCLLFFSSVFFLFIHSFFPFSVPSNHDLFVFLISFFSSSLC